MAVIQASDIADLTTTTLNELGENKFTDAMSDYQDTIALKRVFKNERDNFDAGPQIQFNLMTGTNLSARAVGLYAADSVDIVNVMTTGLMPWRHVTWNWGFDRREIAMNRSPRKIVDLIKTRRIAALGDAVLFFELRLWRCPSATDTENIHGIPYWIVKSNTATTTNDGFNGLMPSGYTTVAGLSTTTLPRWANYATQYTAITKDDLIRKMRRAIFKTNFKRLVEQVPEYNTGDRYSIYSNYNAVATMEELLEAQNENLGNDLASKDGAVVIRRMDVMPIKQLDEDTTNPVYGVNWGEMKVMGLRGEWMKETQLDTLPGKHTVSATHTDCSCNLICRNRRRNWVLSTDTTLPS